MPKHFTKIDRKGNYSKFPGVTVVAGVKYKDIGLWEEVYDCIHKITRGYYTPLPRESYHMTAVDLYTETAIGSGWKEFVRSKLSIFRGIYASFQDQIINPRVKIETTKVGGVIQLCLTLPQEQEKIIHLIAKTFNIEELVPRVFHITLAYQFKTLESGRAKTMEEQIQTEMKRIFAKYDNVITLEPPRLCYFNNMTMFVPWNGDDSPFEHSHTYHLHDFFKLFSSAPVDPANDTVCKL